jgi:UDP-GlcNAc:undecaprenyl-phosphate GlcNAc-1-phosphate transferase
VLWLILLNVGVYVSTFYLMPVLIEMIRPRQSALNYQNREVPVGLGLVFSLTVVPSLIIGLIVGLLSIRQRGIAIITILSFGLLGLIDDTLGSREARGFRGHFRALRNGYLTTGALKAGFGFVIAVLTAVVAAGGVVNITLNALNIALCANLANLLDVRPGRAGKFYLFSVLVFGLVGHLNPFLLLTAVSAAAYLPWDLNAEVMMGDVGSNVLGAVIGLTVMEFSVAGKAAVLFFLVIVHFYAERRSLTDLIEKTPFLNYLDLIGRKKV